MVNKFDFRSFLTAGVLALALSATACTTSSTPTGTAGGSTQGTSNTGMPKTTTGVNDPTTKTAHQGAHAGTGPVGAGPAGSQ